MHVCNRLLCVDLGFTSMVPSSPYSSGSPSLRDLHTHKHTHSSTVSLSFSPFIVSDD